MRRISFLGLSCVSFLLAIMPMCAQADEYGNRSVGAVKCYDRARRAPMSDVEAMQLCLGSVTDGPVQCYDRATTSTTLSRSDALILCRCSTTPAPVDCFNRARTSTTLSPYEAMQLCQTVGKDTPDARACFYGYPIS
jgi:hypothetical protein